MGKVRHFTEERCMKLFMLIVMCVENSSGYRVTKAELSFGHEVEICK